MKAFPFIVSVVLMALSIAAEAAESIESCDRAFLSREDFESRGGQLVVIKQPDMTLLPKDMAKICSGAAGLGIIVAHDGTVHPDDFEHNAFIAKGETFEMSGRRIGMCDALIEKRVAEIRFAPPKLKERPVCVRFYVDWSSREPTKLLPLEMFSR